MNPSAMQHQESQWPLKWVVRACCVAIVCGMLLGIPHITIPFLLTVMFAPFAFVQAVASFFALFLSGMVQMNLTVSNNPNNSKWLAEPLQT